MEWSLSKLIRIENGTVAISVSDLRSLLAYYGMHDADRVEALLDLARSAKRRMWWDEYRTAMPAALLTFVGFESEASEIGCFHPVLVPGLLQTEAYARALQRGMRPDLTDAEVERRVEFRLRRQDEIFKRNEPPQYHAVLDESVLLRHPDPEQPQVLRTQIEHLIGFAQRPYAKLQIMPLNAGVHRGWDGNFTVMGFGALDGDSEKVFYAQSNPVGDVLLWEEPEVTERFSAVLEEIRGRALDTEASLTLLERALSRDA
jgi:hypothetical protein